MTNKAFGECVCVGGEFHGDELQTFLLRLKESTDLPQGHFRVRAWLRHFMSPSSRHQPSPEGGAWAAQVPNFNFGSTNIAECSFCLHICDLWNF